MTDDYKVGYCRTPVETRIKKGERRNPKGRPKKKKPERNGSLGDDFEEALQQLIDVTLPNGRIKKMNARKAIAFMTVAQALKKDANATKAVFAYERSQGAFADKGPKQKTGVVVVRAPAYSQAELRAREAAMKPLPLNPLEGLPGIDITAIKKWKRPTTPDDDI